ncbi:hypothetical protein M9H77_01345 [Catharanthus roseus]|uniref:Uncharacterized protein n=1 Tax=Catharanthus roseus TaxID=4058 RepID=A0ACC0C5P9_CATRO|nr:hypothetical protein M9H77_01345 [Catharanthus roseus]
MESINNHIGEEEEEEESAMSSSSEEDEEQKEENKLFGVGRSYECVFCRRGFNTAQALGGHMNIHRKDRARINKPMATCIPTSSPSPSSNTNINHHHQIPAARRCSSHHQEEAEGHVVQIEYRTYFPAAASSGTLIVPAPFYANGQYRSSSLYAYDSQHRSAAGVVIQEIGSAGRRRGGINIQETEELDLELRLGPY